MTLLQRREPARRMARFYRLEAGADLFGRVIVMREWGRIGWAGRVRVDYVDRPEDAAAWLARIELAKRRRGYASAGDS
jgi:predicted DNA-binding WGR domain protein